MSMTQTERRLAIRKRLEELEIEGRLTPEAVVNDARDPSSPLHDEFEWDIATAAARHWIDRAREIIRSVRIEVATQTIVVRVPRYVHDPALPSEQGYIAVPKLLSEAELARRALVAECDRAAAILARVRNYAIALGQGDNLEAIIARITELSAVDVST